MIKRTIVIIMALSILLANTGIASAASGGDRAALKASDYLVKQQHDDGGFGAKDSTVTETSVTIIALKAAGTKLPKSKKGKTTIDYLKANAPALASGDSGTAIDNTAKISQMIIALKLAGEDPKKFAGTNWIELLQTNQEKATSWYGNYDIDHMWALLALKQTGVTPDAKAIKWLQGNQAANGGYSIDTRGGMGPDTNATALAIQALIANGIKPTDPSVKKGLDFLKTQQNTDGGFPYVTPSPYGTESDANSTAWVLQGLVAAGEDIESKYWIKTAVTTMGFLMSLQNANGAFAYQKSVPDDSELSTAQAVPALLLKPYPIKLTPPASTTEKLPKDNATFNTSSLLMIGLLAIAALVAVAALGLFIARRREGQR